MQILKYNIASGTLAALALLHAARCSDIMVKEPASQPHACPCEYNFRPVCGSDGVTYTNKCVLECHNAAAAKRGIPPVGLLADDTCAACACQPLYLPVCTVDGQTYPNECELACEINKRVKENKPLVFLAYRAACLGPPCSCSNIASPVCGSDDILYRNLCELECATANAKTRGLPPIEFKNVGACLDGCQCPDIKRPVCGSDGVEYGNLCEIACQNRKQAHSPSAPITPASQNVCQSCACPGPHDPVCGSDGKLVPRTFPNMCEMQCEARRTNNPYLSVIGPGPCPDCFCTGEHLPVCGSDGKTYENECELRCANGRRAQSDAPISVWRRGACQAAGCDCRHCPKDYTPMCGSDQVTYWNLCWLRCSDTCSQDYGKRIFLAKRGACSL